MKRRNIELFNLSFLDILSGALGAVLFLFIVVPKGGESPSRSVQLSLTLDTTFQKAFGQLPDSLLSANAGDTLMVIVKDFGKMPQVKDCPPPRKCPKCPEVAQRKVRVASSRSSTASVQKPQALMAKSPSTPSTSPSSSAYKGDLPSVPCKLSVEVKWEDIDDNIDLYVCKDGSCVYGGTRRRSSIGFWDSGKSKTSIFGGDLRTTQEAVRQFDQILPGKYDIYLQFKASEKANTSARVSGLLYTKNEGGKEQGKTFDITLPLDQKNRTHVGSIEVDESGTFNFNSNI